MHWDQMTDTPEDLRRRATRLRRGMGQLGVLESIIDSAQGPWLGTMDADGRGTAELRMHLAGRYRVAAAVTSAGKLSLVHISDLTRGRKGERVLSGKTLLRKGWTDTEPMPKQPEWLEYVVSWVENVSGEVDRRLVVEWQLTGADRRLASLNDTIEGMRASLDEQEQVRDQLATEVAALRSELESLGARPESPAADLESPEDDFESPGNDLESADEKFESPSADSESTSPELESPSPELEPSSTESEPPTSEIESSNADLEPSSPDLEPSSTHA